MPKISVIIPIYNTAQYLRRCIDSVLSQSFCDFELLLIDDGSTDESPQICDEYASSDNRVKVIHQSNQGLGAARKLALDMAIGDYISFVDSDDWVDSNMLEENFNLAITKNADIVVFDYFNVSLDNCVASTHSEFQLGKDLVGAIINHDETTYIWDKLFRRNFLHTNGISFTKGIDAYEDCLFCLKVFNAQPIIAYNHKTYYYYTVLRQGAMTTNFKDMCIGQKNFLNFLLANDSFDINLGKDYVLKSLVNLVKYEFISKTEISQILHHSKIKAFLHNLHGQYLKRLILWLVSHNAYPLIHSIYRIKLALS